MRHSEDSYGYYGLATGHYTHFISPICRYPDLIVRHLIRSCSQDQSERSREKWNEALPEIVNHSSSMEHRVVNAKREVDAMKKTEFMVDEVRETYDGVISSATKFGIPVELPNTIEGLIHVSNLK